MFSCSPTRSEWPVNSFAEGLRVYGERSEAILDSPLEEPIKKMMLIGGLLHCLEVFRRAQEGSGLSQPYDLWAGLHEERWLIPETTTQHLARARATRAIHHLLEQGRRLDPQGGSSRLQYDPMQLSVSLPSSWDDALPILANLHQDPCRSSVRIDELARAVFQELASSSTPLPDPQPVLSARGAKGGRRALLDLETTYLVELQEMMQAPWPYHVRRALVAEGIFALAVVSTLNRSRQIQARLGSSLFSCFREIVPWLGLSARDLVDSSSPQRCKKLYKQWQDLCQEEMYFRDRNKFINSCLLCGFRGRELRNALEQQGHSQEQIQARKEDLKSFFLVPPEAAVCELLAAPPGRCDVKRLWDVLELSRRQELSRLATVSEQKMAAYLERCDEAPAPGSELDTLPTLCLEHKVIAAWRAAGVFQMFPALRQALRLPAGEGGLYLLSKQEALEALQPPHSGGEFSKLCRHALCHGTLQESLEVFALGAEWIRLPRCRPLLLALLQRLVLEGRESAAAAMLDVLLGAIPGLSLWVVQQDGVWDLSVTCREPPAEGAVLLLSHPLISPKELWSALTDSWEPQWGLEEVCAALGARLDDSSSLLSLRAFLYESHDRLDRWLADCDVKQRPEDRARQEDGKTVFPEQPFLLMTLRSGDLDRISSFSVPRDLFLEVLESPLLEADLVHQESLLQVQRADKESLIVSHPRRKAQDLLEAHLAQEEDVVQEYCGWEEALSKAYYLHKESSMESLLARGEASPERHLAQKKRWTVAHLARKARWVQAYLTYKKNLSELQPPSVCRARYLQTLVEHTDALRAPEGWQLLDDCAMSLYALGYKEDAALLRRFLSGTEPNASLWVVNDGSPDPLLSMAEPQTGGHCLVPAPFSQLGVYWLEQEASHEVDWGPAAMLQEQGVDPSWYRPLITSVMQRATQRLGSVFGEASNKG